MSQAPVTAADMEATHQQHSESSTPITSPSPVNPGDHGAIYTRLRNQVEFYFSPQNLARDTYLRNMLTAKHQEVPSPPPLQLVTPVAVITNFPKVRNICAAFGASLSDPPHVILARACAGSTVVSVSEDGAWIGPTSQQLPPLTDPTPPRMGPPTPQAIFQQGPYPPSPHQRMMMMSAAPMGEVQPMPYMGSHPVPAVQNIPLSHGSVSPSSNSLDSIPSQVKETVVVVPDMPAECNPILLMTAFTTGNIRPSSVSAEANTNNWYVSFTSEADAKAAISATSEKTVVGAPIKAKLKTEPASARASVASASAASLSSMSASQRQQIPVPQMVQQPVPMPGAAMMYPPGAYPMGHSPPPPIQPGMPHYPMGGPQYGMAPMPMPGQPFPPYPHMQPMYPYGYVPQHGPPPYPMNQPPMMGRFGPGVPPPPPRYPAPPYPYHHGPQHHMGDGPVNHDHRHPPRPHNEEEREHASSFQEGSPKKNEPGGKKKRNKYQKQHSSGSLEGGSNQQFGSNHSSRENTSSPNNFDRRRGRHGDNFRRSTGSASPAFNRHQRGSRSSGGGGQSNEKKRNENKEIFDANDFPGLSGDGKQQILPQPGDANQKNEAKVFSGYAEALKKKDAEKAAADKESNATKETDISDIDSITRQTEAMEREILSDFHDLTIPGDEDNHVSHNRGPGNGDTTQQTKPFEHLPILPGMSSLGQSLSLDEPASSSPLHHDSNNSEMRTDDKQAETTERAVTSESSRVTIPPEKDNEENSQATSAWGAKRLFADVSSFEPSLLSYVSGSNLTMP